jgi:ATP-dependent Clp protease protease subunit
MLKIIFNTQIVPEGERMAYVMSGEGFPTTYTDISLLLDYYPDEEEVMLELHSCGGDTTEGWAIYDALRASGRTIHAKVVGECASMATILFLSAPRERRSIAKHGKMLIHSPYFPDAGEVTRSNIDSLKAMLEEEHNKMLDTYVERTGMDRETLETQMNNGGWFDADKAVELGFAGFIAPELSAQVNKTKSMKKNKLKAAFEAFVQAFSTSALTFTTKDGQELELEKEEGDIEVGDAAEPDGEFVLEDGRIITVKDGVVVDIKQAEEEQPEEEEAPETEAVEEPKEEEAPAEDVEELKKQIEELKKENEELKKQLEEQKEVIAAVDALGGKNFLAKQSSKQLTIARKATEKKKAEEDNPYAAILAAKREALKKKK